jgi:hypothetical protein
MMSLHAQNELAANLCVDQMPRLKNLPFDVQVFECRIDQKTMGMILEKYSSKLWS